MLLSILIPTLEERAESFAFIHAKLTRQIREGGLEDEVEVLSLVDGGELPTGVKRNLLMEKARGRFVASVDDDDDVHGHYVALIVEAIRATPDVDCVGIQGRVTFREHTSRRFVYSIRYGEYRTRGGVYERPPHHLNPIRADIARQYPFEPVRTSEDSDWALRLSRDGALQTEVFIDDVLYHYRCRRAWAYQRLLDQTEFIRHPLGLQWVNRFRLRRWWQSLRAAPDRDAGG
ncbi:hypothetical protein [Rubrivirga sp. IMCC43871]|uniref:hypothetical protein n=1 Tax=Rubrivirga sp. IMCC43871 TaxID=3391575 RepID=UPI00398FDCD1